MIGCGAVAEVSHLPALSYVLPPELVWLVDRDRERAEKLALSFGVPKTHVFDEHSKLLETVDAAIVAVPPNLHREITCNLLEYGIHVLCEKPLASTLADGKAILQSARAAPSVVAVGFVRRFFPTLALVADLLRGGLLGNPRHVVVEEGSGVDWASLVLADGLSRGSYSDFLLHPSESGGGILAGWGVHVLDSLRTWLGPDFGVVEYRDNAWGGVETDCLIHLDGQVTGTVELSLARELANVARIECEKGTIKTPTADMGDVVLTLGSRIHRLNVGSGNPYTDAFRAQLVDFLSAAATGRRPTVTVDDGFAVLDLVTQCYRLRDRLEEPWVTETLIER